MNEGLEEEWMGKLAEAIWREGGVVKANSGEGWTGNLRGVLELLAGEAGRVDVGLMPEQVLLVAKEGFERWRAELTSKGVEVELKEYEKRNTYGNSGVIMIGGK